MSFSNHAKYINSKGDEVPSVTTILSIINKPSLCKWANYIGIYKHENINVVLKKSAEKGTVIHELINAYLFNKEISLSYDENITKDYVYKTLDNFINWAKVHNIKPILGESGLISDKFGGTVDLYCELDGVKTVIDFKSSKSFYAPMFLQLAAYTYMLEERDYVVEQVGVLLVNDRGCVHKFISREDIQVYINAFLVTVELFNILYYDINPEWGDIIEKKG